MDKEDDICYERLGVAEINEISEDAAETDVKDEGQQVERSLEECQEVLGEVSAEKTRVDFVEENGEPMEDVVHESLSKFPPETTENYAKDAAMEQLDKFASSQGEKKVPGEPPNQN